MEYKKILLLFSILIAYSLSQGTEEEENLARSNVGCNRVCCGRNRRDVQNEQQCTCFPIELNNIPVPEYMLKNTNDGQLTRTVIYLYTIGNKSTIYIPNQQKQSLYIDLTFDDGDLLRPLASPDLNKLISQKHELSHENEEVIKPGNVQIQNTNYPVKIDGDEDKNDSPEINQDRNEDALKHILENDDVFVSEEEPELYPSQQGFGQNGINNVQSIVEPQTTFEVNPIENEYSHVNEPHKNIVLKPIEEDWHVQGFAEPQKDVKVSPNAISIPKPISVGEPSVNEFVSEHVDKPKTIVGLEPGNKNMHVYDHVAGPPRDFGLNPIENERGTNIVPIPQTDFGWSQDKNQLPEKVLESKPFKFNKQIHRFDRPQSVPVLNPIDDELNLHNFGKPPKVFGSKQTYDIPRPDYGVNSERNYLSLQQNAEPQTILGLKPSGSRLEGNIESHRVNSNLHSKQPNAFGYGGNPHLDIAPKPQIDIGSRPSEEDLYLNNIASPQRKVELEFDENDLQSASLFKSQPNIRCMAGICKLHIYCSRNDCVKYLLSLSNLNTNVRRHPHLENTFIVINNNTGSNPPPIFDPFGPGHPERAMMQNVRNGKFGSPNPKQNPQGRLVGQQVPRSIPIGFNPLSSILDPGNSFQNLLPARLTPGRRSEYYPRNSQLISSKPRNPYYSELYTNPINDNYYRRSGAAPNTTGDKSNIFKELLLLPSKFHHEGMKTVADLLPNLNLRRLNTESVVPEGVDIPGEEDDIKIRIIGGQPATSSGTPMQIRARLGNA